MLLKWLTAWKTPWTEDQKNIYFCFIDYAKASRKQSSLSGKESAQGCLPKRLLGRPD